MSRAGVEADEASHLDERICQKDFVGNGFLPSVERRHASDEESSLEREGLNQRHAKPLKSGRMPVEVSVDIAEPGTPSKGGLRSVAYIEKIFAK